MTTTMDERTILTAPQGCFDLLRLHDRPDSPLRAWDAADSYVLEHLANLGLPVPDRPVPDRPVPDLPVPDRAGRSLAVVNDAHGALAVALAAYRPTSISDSFVSQLATLANLERNGLDADAVTICSTLEPLPASLSTAIVKVPKSLSLLEHQLKVLAPHLQPDTVVVGAGMTRHIHTSTLGLFDRIIGPTTTSLARRKARLIHATPARSTARSTETATPTGTADEGLEPSSWPSFALPDGGPTVSTGPGVFSGAKLDDGTRLLLGHLATRPPSGRNVIDLGCGNGIVGLTILLADPDATVSFLDESPIAVRSAHETVRRNAEGSGGASLLTRSRFLLGDALETTTPESVAPGTAELIVVNPPFHDDHAIGDATAWRMFTGAHRTLRSDGEILVVGNRHLGYHTKIARLFGNVDVVASNPKFVVLSAQR